MTKKAYIFIVDDIVKNLQVLGSMLMDEGYEVGIASNGEEALRSLTGDLPDLILLDVMMPVMDGFETCERLKADEKTRHIPVIFLTAKTDQADIVRGFSAGGVDYVTKPFSREELLARVRTHLELKYAREELAGLNSELEDKLKIISDDLDKASGYIKSLLPRQLDSEGLSINWKFEPCYKLGGDTFGYHYLDNENIAFYLIDVCGHGVGSALHSVSILNTIRFGTMVNIDYHEPGDVLDRLNGLFQMADFDDMFFTIWYGVYNTVSGLLRFSAGGHHPAILLTGDGNHSQTTMLECNNLVTGALPDYSYRECSIKIQKGSVLYVFSDGAFEIRKRDGTMWDLRSLALFLEKNHAPGITDLETLYFYLTENYYKEKLDDDFSILKLSFI